MSRFKSSVKNSILFVIAGCLTFLISCNKDFDSPPDLTDPMLTVTKTIKQLKAIHVAGQVEALGDDIISGIVVADDKSGNYYKQISIQDETGGITIRLDGLSLYANYPVGRKIYIKTKGLFIGEYAGLIQIGGSINNSDPASLNVNPLASDLFDTHIVKATTNNPVVPKVVTVADLNDDYLSMLIQLENAEFTAADTSKAYAVSATASAVNLNVKTCAGGAIIVRTSTFANFAGINVPNGNGKLTAIYTKFNATKQLIIRDTSDVQFTGPRCTSGGVTGTLTDISAIRALFTGTTTNVPANKKITGIVISDKSASNITSRNIVLQQGNGLPGIAIRFDADNTFALGDSIEIGVSGAELSEFNGLLQLNNVPLDNASLLAAGKTITPRAATVTEILANFEAWESTLVKVSGITLPAGNWSGSTTITQGGSSIVHFTQSYASFANSAKPSGSVDMTAIVSQGGSTKAQQLSIRNTNDVSGGTTTPPPAVTLINTSDVRALFTGTTTTIPAGKKITGIVISDKTGSNITSKNIVLQQGNGLAGIVVRFTADNTFDLGDSIDIDVSGAEISEFNGLLQVNNIANAKATKVSSGKSITPAVITIADLVANFESRESTLIKLSGVTLTPAGDWKGSATVTQSGNTITHFTQSYAAFANTAKPTASVTLTAIVSQGGTAKEQQIGIRNTADVQ